MGHHPHENSIIPIRLMSVARMLVLSGCSTATDIRAHVSVNPLDRVAPQAREDWSVERLDANTLNINDAGPIHSGFSFGSTASYANLVCDPSDSTLTNSSRISWLPAWCSLNAPAWLPLVTSGVPCKDGRMIRFGSMTGNGDDQTERTAA